MLSPTLRGTIRNKVRAPRWPQMTAHEDLQHFTPNHVHTHDIPPGVRRKRWSRRSTFSIEGGEGYFVNSEWLVLFPVNCEISPVLFLVKRDFGNRREPWFLFNSPWTLIFFHVIVNSLGNLNFNCSIEQLGTYCVTETSFSTQALRHVAATTLGTCLGQPTWRKQDRKLRSRDSTKYNCFDDCAFQSFFIADGNKKFSIPRKKNWSHKNVFLFHSRETKCWIYCPWNVINNRPPPHPPPPTPRHFITLHIRPYNPVREPLTSMYSCHSVFMEQFIFKTANLKIC